MTRLATLARLLPAIAFLAACSSGRGVTGPTPPAPADTAPPALLRETRGLWIATVGNIDWPSRSGLPADQQRAELLDLLDRARATGLNTIVFHVRPAADAVYRSDIEPWGAMLMGTQGSDPGWDPLAFAVQEAHARGLELHAWVNPFRAGNTADSAKLAPAHVWRAQRELGRVYGTQLWLDPGEPGVHDHTMRVIADIVRRYDVDGIHADDYFYPYQQTDASGRVIPFPDDSSYAKYGNGVPRDDWRRANVDRFVERMYREVHAIKPTVKVGISPFGIWRPGNPAGVAGLDAYATIYADSRRWLQQGWLDYLAPQLYWAIGAPQQSFPALLDWWLAQNAKGRHVWPGLAAYKVQDGSASAFSATEIQDQIRLVRQRSGGTGHLLYNTTWTLKRSGGALATSLASDLYTSPAFPPASPWLDGTAPPAPTIAVSGGTLTITPGAGEAPRWFVVRARGTGGWTSRTLFGDTRTMPLVAPERVLVQAADAAGNLSSVVEWNR